MVLNLNRRYLGGLSCDDGNCTVRFSGNMSMLFRFRCFEKSENP